MYSASLRRGYHSIVSFPAKPCIISMGMDLSQAIRKSSTRQWTEAPSAKPMWRAGASLRFRLIQRNVLMAPRVDATVARLRFTCASRCP